MKPGNSTILVVNCGSSSIRFAVYSMNVKPQKHLSGKIERIGLADPSFTLTNNISNEKSEIKISINNFKEAGDVLTEWLIKQKDINQIKCIGHRIVHGMEHTQPIIIDDSLLRELHEISAYDPDHLPSEIELIELFKKQFPHLPQVACFDTAFHTSMLRVAKILPIPRCFDREGVRHYGFHGLSYIYLMEKLNTMGNDKGKIILAHLGNGASMAAVKDGKSMDTSMGFTPAGGLVMGTRSGDLDPGVAWYMIQKEKMTSKQFNHLINHQAGLLGVSEISSDMQELLTKEKDDIRAKEAVDLFCYNAKKWIGAYTAVLNGLDVLVFSGGIGENAPVIRSRICKGFGYLGIEIDENENNKNTMVISTGNSKVKVYVIPTDEEIIIAKSSTELYNTSLLNKIIINKK